MHTGEKKLLALLIAQALFWLGLLVGVAFLATPIKFLAPSLELPVALDVGRQTFAAFNTLELLLGLMLTLTAWFRYRAGVNASGTLLSSCSLLALVLLQSLWLLPVLDARVAIILQGGTPPPASLHLLYIGVDVIKLALLGSIAWKFRMLLRTTE